MLVEFDHDFTLRTSINQQLQKCADSFWNSSSKNNGHCTWQQWQDHNIPPEISRNKRCPTWAKSLEVIERRRKTKLRYYQ